MKYNHIIIEAILLIALVIVGIYAVLQSSQTQEERKLPKLTTITGEFTTSKGYTGVVNGILLPYFANKPNETAEYSGKIVEVKGVIYDPEIPSDFIGQSSSAPLMAIESIRIIES